MASGGNIPAGGKRSEEPRGWRSMKQSIKLLWQFVLSNRVIPVAGWQTTPGGLLPPAPQSRKKHALELTPQYVSGAWRCYIEPGKLYAHESQTRFFKPFELDINDPPDNYVSVSGTKDIVVKLNWEFDGTYWLCTDTVLEVQVVAAGSVPADDIPILDSFDSSTPPTGSTYLVLGTVVTSGTDVGYVQNADGIKNVQDAYGSMQVDVNAFAFPSGSGTPGSPGTERTYWNICVSSGGRDQGWEYVKAPPVVPTPMSSATQYWKLMTPFGGTPYADWVPEPFTRLTPVSASYSGRPSREENVILANATAGEVTVNLPDPAVFLNYPFIVKKTDNSGNDVVLTPYASETIDGASELRLASQWDAATVVSDGTDWYIV